MDETPSINPNAQELEQQMTRGAYYVHTAITRQAERLNESEAFLYGLIDALIDSGAVDADSLRAKVATVREEVRMKGEQFTAGVLLRQDPPTEPIAPEMIARSACRSARQLAAVCRLR